MRVLSASVAASCLERTVNIAAPKQINIFVRSPAGLWRSCRSSPMIPPRMAATNRRSMVEESTRPISVKNGSIIEWRLGMGGN